MAREGGVESSPPSSMSTSMESGMLGGSGERRVVGGCVEGDKLLLGVEEEGGLVKVGEDGMYFIFESWQERRVGWVCMGRNVGGA